MASLLQRIVQSSVVQQYAGTAATLLAGIALVQLVRSAANGPSESEIPPIDDDQYEVSDRQRFDPQPIDVIVVKVMLEKAAKLPPELLNIIFDQAEYWPHSHVEVNYDTPLRIMGSYNEENKFLLRCPPIGFTSIAGAAPPTYQNTPSNPLPLGNEHERTFFNQLIKNTEAPTLMHPVRKIVFKIKSKDQGWGGQPGDKGTFRGSWTWFEAGLEKFDAKHTCTPECNTAGGSMPQEAPSESPRLPVCALRSIRPDVDANPDGRRWFKQELPPEEQWKIQANKTASREEGEYEIVWSRTDDIDPESPAALELSQQGRGTATGNGAFLRSLKIGDVVTVWGMARFGGWVNVVSSVSVDIYWAI